MTKIITDESSRGLAGYPSRDREGADVAIGGIRSLTRLSE